MNGLCIEVVSKETIRPSSPTPSHLNNVRLSLIDQLQSRYIPLLFFFPASATPNTVRVARLKKSLSESLTLFYPFAGKIVGNQFIDCNDDGISFSETRVNTQMARVLNHPIPEELFQLIPTPEELAQFIPVEDTRVLLSVGINIFDCGGMVLCASLSHLVADASSFGFFLSTWAAIARGDSDDDRVARPEFAGSRFFPPVETGLPADPFITHPELVSKRFIFNAANISSIRDNCRDKLPYSPTRVEAVSAFLWRCGMNAAGCRSSVLFQGMNLRTRMDPPLANSFVGNFISGVLVRSSSPMDLEYCLVDQLHQAISKVDGDYMRKLQYDNGNLELNDSLNELTHESSSFFTATSWCRFPFYEADFGWGKPEWVTTVQTEYPDLMILMDTKCGTGIEAWVTMKKQVMGKFESDPQLIAYTSKT